MTISYSPRAADAIGFLKARRNDIDIFVEDASKLEIWTALIRKAMPREVEIDTVNALGSKADVISACRDYRYSGRPALYIVDADFDVVLGLRPSASRELFVMPATNLEAALFCLNGVERLISDMCPALNGDFEYKDFRIHIREKWEKPLRTLFFHYGLHYSASGNCKTSSFHVSRLTVANIHPYSISKTLILKQLRDVRDEIVKNGVGYSQGITSIRQRCIRTPIEKIVSGKTYLFPILENYLIHRHNIKMNRDVLMKSIISRSTNVLPSLRRKVKIALK